MSSPATIEQGRLRAVAALVHAFAVSFEHNQDEARLQLLESVAARLGSHNVSDFQKAFGRKLIAAAHVLDNEAAKVLAAIRNTGIEPALALSALSREDLTVAQQRKTGA
ncbi:hypothetical protein, partial [Xanthomonas hortorum]